MAKTADETVQIKFRIEQQLRERLEKAAEEQGASLNAEITRRLKSSLDNSQLDEEIGDQAALAVGRAVALAMREAGRLAGFHATFSLEGSRRWFENPFAYRQAQIAAHTIIDALRPEGEPTPPASSGTDVNLLLVLGEGVANALLEEGATGRARVNDLVPRMELFRKLLGELAGRLSDRGVGKEPMVYDVSPDDKQPRMTAVLSKPDGAPKKGKPA